MEGERDPGLTIAPLGLRFLAGVVLLPGFWVSVVLAVVAVLPAGLSPRFQVPVQVACVLPAAALAWFAVRRAPPRLLALLIPAMLVLYFLALALLAKLPITA
jgi:hypothetical protein